MKKKIAILLLAGVVALQQPMAIMASSVSQNEVASEDVVSAEDEEGAAEDTEEASEESTEEAQTEEIEETEGEESATVSAKDVEDEDVLEGRVFGYRDIDARVPEVTGADTATEEYTMEKAAIPASYRSDKLGYITCLKNQGNYGTCWAFSAIAACEASLIKKGITNNSVDLSELHLAYFFYNKSAQTGDLFSNTVGDYNRSASNGYLNAGGNSYFTMWQLASWAGPTTESDYKYTTASSSLTLEDNAQTVYGKNAFHLQNSYIINTADRASMKQMIMNYGALGISYYSATSVAELKEYDSMYAGKSTGDEGSYYCDETNNTNHAVTVVGWDDNYSASNFVNTPAGNGAWLIKNSWGAESSSYSQDGYFWIS